MEYKDDEQPTLEDAAEDAAQQQSSALAAVPASLLPSVLGRLGLGDILGGQAYEPKAVLRDEKRTIRIAVVRRLGEEREAASLGVLVAALHDPAWEVRAAVVWALGSFGEQAPVEALLAALADEDGSVRAAALRTLCRLNRRVALESALRLLSDAEWPVREAAALTLGELGEQVPLESLMVSLHDENAFVRKAAQIALEQAHPEALSTLPPVPGIFSTDTYPSLRKHEQMRSTSHRSWLLHFFNGIAAVLVVCLLISGALLLFVPRHANNAVSPHPSTRSVATDIPFTPFPWGCFFLPQISCPHNPFTQLHLSRAIGGYTITIKQAYADANETIIEYSVTRDSDHRFVFATLNSALTIQQGAVPNDLAGGDNGEFDPKTQIGSEEIRFGFDATTIPTEGAKNLSVHLIVNSIDDISDPGITPPSHTQLPLEHNPVTFDFSLPFHSGQIFILHKTVTVAGASITLERMVATPSQTRFHVQGKNVSLAYGFSLTDSRRSVGDIADSVGGVIDRFGRIYVTNPSTSVILDYDPVFESNAVCTFTVTAPASQHKGPWVFHFVVP